MTTLAPPVPVRPETTARRPRLRAAVSVLLTVVMTAALALAAALVVVPKALGAVPLTVLTGSMRPALSPGDVVVVRPVEATDVRVGDVITFQPRSGDPALVTHRVVGLQWGAGDAPTFVTRGDANDAADDPVVADQVKGRVAYSVPWVGHLTNASWGTTAVTVAGAALLVYAVGALVLPARRRREEPS